MIPASVQWELTARCNYSCQHCYRIDANAKEHAPLELPNEDMLRIAEILISNRLFFVTLTGGEPLVRKELSLLLTEKLTQGGIRVSLNTNLSLIDEKVLARLRLYGMLISCPSARPKTYAAITKGGSYTISLPSSAHTIHGSKYVRKAIQHLRNVFMVDLLIKLERA